MARAEERYRMGRVIGQGGSSLVYEAWERVSGREVALKMLHPAALGERREDERVLDRFLREISILAAVKHPSMVSIYDFGLLDGLPFYAMERLRGLELSAQLMKHGAMSPERALPLVSDVLGALEACHQAGFVHKDLKPDNLFLTEDERLVVFDFGFASSMGDERYSGRGEIYGTVHYLAPEYIHEQVVTPAMDVYQMGLVLVEMLWGRRVVMDRRGYDAMLRHLEGRLELPNALRESPIGPILRRALSVDPGARYPSAGALRDALSEVEPTSLPELRPAQKA